MTKATPEQARLVLSAWNASHGPGLRIREADLRWNLSEQDLVEYGFHELAGVPCLLAEAAPAGQAMGIPASTLWLPLWGDVPRGREADFVNAFVSHAAGLGKNRVLFGADEFHFLPGIPTETAGDAGARLADAVKAAGFEGAEAADFTGSLAQPEVGRAVDEADATARARGWRFLPADTEAAMDALSGFLRREFPGRWSRELETWRARKDTGRAFWRVLTKDAEILGFARMAVRGRVPALEDGWTPGALRLPLAGADSSADDGCLGPIGVAASQRGKGAGKVLLGLVLQALRHNHARRICIDWTNAFKYYEPLNFERARQYWTAWRSGIG